MNNRFIQSCHIPLYYKLKEGTKGSFYQKAGKRGILPNRISMGIFAQQKASKKDTIKLNELNGQYKKAEAGLYKELNKGRIHSSIWEAQGFPELYGYGILDERHQIYDLLILESEDNLSASLSIHIFRGLGKPDYLHEAFSYLRKQKAPRKGL